MARTSASWVFVERATGKAVMETFNPKLVAKLNTEKYRAVPIGEYLAGFNKSTYAWDSTGRSVTKPALPPGTSRG
jgi:hypothetical protein